MRYNVEVVRTLTIRKSAFLAIRKDRLIIITLGSINEFESMRGEELVNFALIFDAVGSFG
jgi:hypothetical protein